MSDIICSGFGGQGILTSGLILAKIAMEEGLEVTWIPSYGSEMRGGTANCAVKIDKRPVASPFVGEVDLLIAMNTPSVEKFEPMMRPGGIMAVNSSIVESGRTYRSDVTVVKVSAGDIADEIKNPRGANLVALAAGVAKSGLFERDAFIKGVEKFFADKGKVNPLNQPCLERGWAAA
ncbi:2-oxoacid:acceptor oxidoreductase family protein [Deltaproteobacteria bacterium OttesenSCG-928-K17]|nr:2-oxoacid:acceptor oxidoreductase family protein [Deltaproteobacteria bacterium OttesenSCG-928-K17]